jgi:endoglucanase
MNGGAFGLWAVLGGALVSAGCGGGPGPDASDEAVSAESDALAATQLFIPKPDPNAIKQVAALVEKRDLRGALLVTAMVTTPQAVWFTGGTPSDVQQGVRKVMTEAALERRVPVLVAYNVPFRDCAQYSAGGALDTTAYEAWIDGFVKGIGQGKAIVILEPDSLGLIPYNTTIYGATDSCQPTVVNADGTSSPAPGASSAERYTQLQYAGAALTAKAPNATVYLDGTHSAWLGVGEAAFRINKASHDPVTGAPISKGFYLNASNFRTSAEATQFGTWISMCTAFATDPEEGGWRLGNYSYCASQYNPATGFALDYSADYVASVTAQIQGLMGTSVATLPFVIDTSRNGLGPLDASSYAAAPYNQPADVIATLNADNWCNPPGRGVGLRPTLTTNVPLVDAYLWIKTPGQSDGSCDIAGGARAWDYSLYNPWQLSGDAQNHFDPLWGLVDPAAGVWFPQQALELAEKASPRLL